MPDLDPRSTVLVFTDLKNGIARMPPAPRGGPDVLDAGRRPIALR